MDWKQLLYKVGKGAISGALAGLAVVQLANLPAEKTLGALVSAAVVGAFHGIANAIEQVKAG